MEYKTTTKLKQSTLWKKEAKINHKTEFYRITGGDGVPLPPPHYQ